MSASGESVAIQGLRDLLLRVSPQAWRDFGAAGVVLLEPDEDDERFLVETAREWAKEGFAFRMPHHSVSSKSLYLKPHTSDVDRAVGGILLLTSLALFSTTQLRNLASRIVSDRLPVTVIGFDYMPADGTDIEFQERMQVQADALGLQLVPFEAIPLGDEADVADELSAINLHRVAMGMARLDPVGQGWTDEDVRLEAERIRRLPNPLLDLKRSLMDMRGHRRTKRMARR